MTTNNAKPVCDVLEVMEADAWVAECYRAGYYDQQELAALARRSDAARAAVAELIAAAERFARFPETEDVRRLRAALAAVGARPW